MARLTRDERLERLQHRYNELVKPVLLVGNSFASGVKATTVLSNGKMEGRQFNTADAFQTYANSLENCNVIFDKQVTAFREDTLQAVLQEVDKKDLLAIVCAPPSKETADRLARILYEGMIRQFS